jgi:hypothetical protein
MEGNGTIERGRQELAPGVGTATLVEQKREVGQPHLWSRRRNGRVTCDEWKGTEWKGTATFSKEWKGTATFSNGKRMERDSHFFGRFRSRKGTATFFERVRKPGLLKVAVPSEQQTWLTTFSLLSSAFSPFPSIITIRRNAYVCQLH